MRIGLVRSCQANPDDVEPFLIFITPNDVRRSTVNGTNYQTIVGGLQNGVAIDFHYYNNRIYWTDVSLGHIRTAPLTTGYPVNTIVSGIIMSLMHYENGSLYGLRDSLHCNF